MLLSQFTENWRRLDMLYVEYAKTLNLSYTSMKILYYIYKGAEKGIAQTALCEKTSLPKQTVHSVITGFLKQGLIELIEDAEDRRVKPIRLTPQGVLFCKEAFEKLDRAEATAMDSIDYEKRKLLVLALAEYGDAFEKALR